MPHTVIESDEIIRMLDNIISDCENLKSKVLNLVIVNRPARPDHSDADTTREKNTRHLMFLPMANQLAEIIKSKRNVKITSTQLNTWALHIYRINKLDSYSRAEITAVLNWYGENIGGLYTPDIQSGAALRSKFGQLLKAIERANNDKKRTNRKNLFADPDNYQPEVSRYSRVKRTVVEV